MLSPHSNFGQVDTMRTMGVAYHTIFQARRLGLFDLLAKAPLSAEDIARHLDLRVAPVQAMLELLHAAGVLESGPDGYGNAPVAAEYLVSSSPFFQGMAMELQHRFDAYVAQEFIPLLRDPQTARQHSDDAWSTFDGMQGTAQFARLGVLQDTTAFIASLPTFVDMRTMCDLGGNHGEYSMALLDRNPNLRATLIDLPEVARAAHERIAECGLAERMCAIGSDLRQDPLPQEQFDLVLASHILYAFVPDLAHFVRRVYDSLRPGGWFVAQHMNPAGGMPPLTAKALEFTTRMAGYPTHFIGAEQLEHALGDAGFHALLFAPAGSTREGLLVAGQKHL